MMRLILGLALALYPVGVVSFLPVFKWVLGGEEAPSKTTISGDPTSALEVDLVFDLTATDEKFLQEAKKLDIEAVGNASPLADCHRRLIMSLRKKCSQLDEEQIGKVAVNLLNCQNAIERRPQFPCKSGMLLAECTKPMDPNSWTVYQLMTNRALAVCHSVNQQLFRTRTEMLVTHLSAASRGQLGNLREMHEWHSKLSSLQASAAENMGALNSQHEAMVSRQQELLAKQKSLESALNENVMQLSNDQKILESGSHTLIKITNDVKSQLDSTVAEVERQEELLKIQRQTMDQTMKLYDSSLRELLSELETRGDNLLAVQDLTYLKVQASLEGISKVNESLGVMGNLLISVQNFVNQHTDWARSFFASSKVGSDMAALFASHLALLLFLMIISSFLQFPLVSRIIIITATPLNCYLKLTTEYYASLVELLGAVAAVTVIEVISKRFTTKHTLASKDEIRKVLEYVKTMEQRINDFSLSSPIKEGNFQAPSDLTDLDKFIASSRVFINSNNNVDWDQVSVARSDLSSSTHFSGSGKNRCQGTNKAGKQCKRMTSQSLCATHRQPAQISE